MAGGGLPGGILGLLDLIGEHRAALEYDWRHRFHVSLAVAGTAVMPWGEAVRLVSLLVRDPSSWTGAALAGWDRPFSHEAILLADLFDLEHGVNSRRPPKPHPIRPWETSGRTQRRMGDAAGRTRTEIEAILRRARQGGG